MKLTLATITILASAFQVIAAPAAEAAPESDVSKRAEYSVRECASPNWGGPCNTRFFSADDWNQNRKPNYNPEGSFGPAQGIYCIWYAKDGTASGTVTYPGSDNLGWWATNMDHYKCWW